MSTTQASRPAATLSTPSAWDKAVGFVQRWLGLGRSHDAADTGDIWQLYRMTRGSDSLKPAVIRTLAAHAAR